MRCLYSLFLLIFAVQSFGQQTFETYTPANGLVDARVSGMIQDKYGRIIIYTREGFSIYDGQRFTNYLKVEKEAVGIITGSILLGDSSLYLIRFDGSPVKVEKNRVVIEKDFLKELKEVSAINRVNDSTHIIFSNFGTYQLINRRLKKIVNKSKTIHFTIESSAFGAVFKNNLLFYYNDGNKPAALVLYDLQKEFVVDKLDNLIVNNIIQDNNGNIYLSKSGYLFNLDMEKLELGEISWFKNKMINDQVNLSKADYWQFDKNNDLWFINTNEGCIKVNLITGQPFKINYRDGLFNTINSFFQDRENNYWFISYGKGVQKLIQSEYELLSTINNKIHKQQPYLHNLPDGSVFVNGQNAKYALEDNSTISLAPSKTDSDLPQIFWQNKYWHFNNKSTLQSDGATAIHFNLPGDQSVFDISSKIKTDKSGNIMIAGNSFYLLNTDGSFSAIDLPYFTDNITADDNGLYWAFCRATNKTFTCKYENGQLRKLAEYNSPFTNPRCATHWNADTFLIGTRNEGLWFVKIIKNDISPIAYINRDKGLANNFILDLVKISNKKIALATATGLNIININSKDTSVQNISSVINIYDPIVNLVADRSGNLYAVSEATGALYKYSANQKTNSIYQPLAYFNQIFVNKIAIPKEKINFRYNENNFLFELAAPSFLNNRNIIFNFVLKGSTNKESSNTTGNYEINNLLPGHYELTVRIVYPGDRYPNQKLNYTFDIAEPFWKTWWFLTGIFLLLGSLIWLLVRYFYRKKLRQAKILLEKELAVEQERSRMARELHDGLGSMLSGIKHSFSALNNEMNLDQQQQLKFNSNIENLNETISELRNISHSLASAGLLKNGLVTAIKDYCINICRTGVLNISFKAIDTENLQLTDTQAFHIFRIVQELIQNIIKHAGAKHVIVQLSTNAAVLYLAVEDDGSGFNINAESQNEGMGLKNIRSRVKLLNGKVDFQSEAGKGLSVLIEMPC